MYSPLVSLLAALLPLASALGPSRFLVPTIHELQQKSAYRDSYPIRSQHLADIYPEYNFSVPVDHFHNESRYEPHSDDFFDLRYWFDASHYREGGPVIVVAAGETDAINRIPFLSQGIVSQLAAAYHGIGVILEHRYYGTSFPVANLSTESMRFLSTGQAMADYAYFAQNAVFPGLEHLNLTAATTPWIAYGGSYAGAFVSFIRKLYPQLYWGAVSTSGVTQAILDYWEYMEPIREFGPRDCIELTQTLTDVVDRILIDQPFNRTLKSQLKSAFGLREVRDDADFVNVLTYALGHFQMRSWDSDISDPVFPSYCANITHSGLLYSGTRALSTSVAELLSAAKYDSANTTILTSMLNWIGFLNVSVIADYSIDSYGESRESSLPFSTPRTNPERFTAMLSGTPTPPLSDYNIYSWPYQVCTEWGYFITGSSVPSSTRPLISRLLDLPYTSQLCPTLFNITTPPALSLINHHGGHNFSYPRVAIIDGLADPWRPATPHADSPPTRPSSSSSSSSSSSLYDNDLYPFILIDIPAPSVHDHIRGAVHHWDQNGLSADQLARGREPPDVIVETHAEIVRFVGAWLKGWEEEVGRVRGRVGRGGKENRKEVGGQIVLTGGGGDL